MRTIGTSDLSVFPLCLGSNIFGWTIDEPQSFAVLDAYARTAVDTAKTVGNRTSYQTAARRTAHEHPDLDRWLHMFPTAPVTAVAAWLTGDRHSMSYYPRTDEQPDATIHHLPGAS